MFHFARHGRAKEKPKGTRKIVSAHKKRMRIISTAITFIIIFSLIFLVSYYLIGYFSSPKSAIAESDGNAPAREGDLGDNSLKAALIDALYSNHPNAEFTESLNKTLREVGFEVDVYQGTDVTVDFLKKLNSGYKLIILRMHSSARSNLLYLYTGEPYSAGKYTQEQYSNLVKEAYPTEDSQSFFAVNRDFIKLLMTGKFNGSLVIAMGCDGALDSVMAEEFINQGAIGYVAWTGPVLLSHSDKAILYLVQTLYVDKLTIEEAVEKTNNQIGEDPSYHTILDCHIP